MARILQETKKYILDNYKKGDLTTNGVDKKVEFFLKNKGVEASFKDYGLGEDRNPFPSHLCISVNEEIVHGVCSEKVLK